METMGWGFRVKMGEEVTTPGHADTPVFPLEPVQPQKRRIARIRPPRFRWSRSKPFRNHDPVNTSEQPLWYQV